MSDSMMSIDEAQMWVQQDKSTRSTPRAARTIVAQAETIETLSRLLAGAEGAATELATQIDRVRRALNDITRQKAVSEYDRDHGHDNPEWHGATVDALEYVIDLFNEALREDTE